MPISEKAEFSSTGPGEDFRRVKLVELAAAQRALLLCLIVLMVLQGGLFYVYVNFKLMPRGTTLFELLYASVAIGIAALLAFKGISFGVRPVLAIFLALLGVVPCLGLLVLAWVNGTMNGILRRGNVRVGLAGVSRSELMRLEHGVCPSCGYGLRGLSVASCPNCARAVGLRI